MFDEDIKLIERVRLSLFDLKPKKVLVEIYRMYNDYLSKFFVNGQPVSDYFDRIGCPICSDRNTNELMELDKIHYHRCNSCGAVYTPDMLKNEILMEMYASGAYQDYFNKLVLQGQEIRKDTLELRKCRQISSFFKNPGKILDVGCGSGSLLKVCKENGWEVYGIDPSEGAVKTAKEKYDISVEKGFFEDYESSHKFNCISIVGIEHLQAPMSAIKKAHSLLDDSGILFFEVPSADCFLLNYVKRFPFDVTRYIEAGRHYLFLGQETIHHICNTYGYELMHIESNGLDIDTIIFDDLEDGMKEKMLNIQEIINEMLLGDHYRVYLKKK